MARIFLKVKVMGSKVKVKVKLGILLKMCLAYESCSVGCIGTKMNTYVKNDIVYM